MLLLLGFNGPATEAEPQIIIMRENEIRICKGKEWKVDEEIGYKERKMWGQRERRGKKGEKRRGERRVRNQREIPLHL